MPRTTSSLVSAIIEVDSNINLTPFITFANELVTEACGALGYSAERLEMIERLLAAHFYTLRDPRPTQEQAGPVSASYQSKVGLYLSTSHYGQHAKLLDSLGGLADLEKKAANGQKKPTMFWSGKTADEEALD